MLLVSPARAEGDSESDDAEEPASPEQPAASVEERSLTPTRHSFRTRDSFDGKVGIGAMYMHAAPLGASTGFGQVFWQGDYNGIGGTGFSLHWDVDARAGLAFERRQRTFLNKLNETVTVDENGNYGPVRQCQDPNTPHNPSLFDPCQAPGPNNPPLADTELTRTPGSFYTGRTYDYLRVDQLYASWNSDVFGVSLGRMFIIPAAQSQVDGMDVSVALGRLGRAGVFAGLKPNPWHQQVVGAASGGGISDGAGAFFAPLWGDVVIDQDFSFQHSGAYANELGPGIPWLHAASGRFLTAGLYGSLRTRAFSLDTAAVLDAFNVIAPDNAMPSGIDRGWLHTQGGWRIFGPLTLAFRGTVDVIGARPLMPRDVFVDLRWRNLGPVTLGASYSKINTFATALSYATYFRALEDPDGTIANQDPAKNPFLLGGDPNGAQIAANIANNNLNNGRLFLVDRDRVKLDAALSVGGTLQVYGELIGERRGDAPFVAGQDPLDAFSGLQDSAESLFGGFCFLPANDPDKAVGTNPAMPVHEDLCKLGGSLGLREPFLAGLGSLDIRFTYLDGYFQSTKRLSSRLGTGLGDSLWLELGGAVEQNNNHRVYTSFSPPLDGGLGVPFFTARRTNVYLLDASASWRVWRGLSVEASYFGFVEDVPSQGDTPIWLGEGPQRRDTTQFMQTVFVRSLYRF
jgi:hypothetical protein